MDRLGATGEGTATRVHRVITALALAILIPTPAMLAGVPGPQKCAAVKIKAAGKKRT